MCCQTRTPAYVYKGSLLVQAEEEAFRCQCPCLGCPRRAAGEDLLCEAGYGYEPSGIEASEPLDWSLPPEEEALALCRLSPGGAERVGRMMREARAPELPGGSFPVVNGAVQPRRWEQPGVIRLQPQAFAADNFSVEGGSPLA